MTYDRELCNICRLKKESLQIPQSLHDRDWGIFKMAYYTQEEACTR